MHTRVWDPRKGENYTLEDFETKQVFSSMDEGTFVIEAEGVDWKDVNFKTFLRGLLCGTRAENVALIITPWIKEELFREYFDELVELDCSLPNYVAYFSGANETSFWQIIEARERLGGGGSGEWVIVGADQPIMLDQEDIVGGFSKILSRAKDFEFLIYMAEMQQYLFIFRPFSNVDSFLFQE
jgi:hypothetical protein